jgi:hypothetical protein
MDPELAELLTPGFSYEPYTGRDAFGNKTYGAAVAFSGHYEAKVRRMGSTTSPATDETDAEVVETGSLIVEVMNMQPGGRVTVPGVPPRTLYVASVETESDEIGPYYQEASLEERR